MVQYIYIVCSQHVKVQWAHIIVNELIFGTQWSVQVKFTQEIKPTSPKKLTGFKLLGGTTLQW